MGQKITKSVKIKSHSSASYICKQENALPRKYKILQNVPVTVLCECGSSSGLRSI